MSKNGLLLSLGLIGFLMINPGLVLAADPDCYENGVATLRCVPVLLSSGTNFFFGLAGVAAIFFLIMSGIRFILSFGDPVKVASAKKTATYAILGLIVVVLSFAIINFLGDRLGVGK